MNHRRLASRIAAVLGISSAAAFGVEACGGKVAFDGLGDQGASASGASSSASSSGTFVCDVPVPQGDTKQYLCAMGFQKPCPPNGDGALITELNQELQKMVSPAGGGNCGMVVDQVACADTAAAGCCYDVLTKSQPCLGRPFTTSHGAIVAKALARDDWRIPASPDVASLDARTRASLAGAWTQAALYEHASIASFARFALELLALGAPSDLVAGAQAAALDEVHHAELSFGMASAYAGEPRGPSALATDVAVGRATLAELARATFLEGCVAETTAALLAAEARDAATDAAVRAALDAIAEDEARHAELAWKTVAWALRAGGDAVRRALEEAFASVEAGAPEPSLEGDPATLRAHGELAPEERRVASVRALDDVIRPTILALFASSQASRGAGVDRVLPSTSQGGGIA